MAAISDLGVARMNRHPGLRLLAYTLLAIHFGVIFYIWSTTSLSYLGKGLPTALIGIGQLFGLLAAGCALLQFMLMGRAVWVERAFGLERLAKFHRLNGLATITFILIHPTLLLIGYAQLGKVSLLKQEITFLTQFQDVWMAAIAATLFVAVVFTSIYIVRKHLRYEQWYWVHLMVYAAILLAFSHQIHVGGSFISSQAFVVYWWCLYIFVGLNVLIGRFLLPLYGHLRYGFKVDEIVRETADTVSIYLRGRHTEHFKMNPGQFIIIWIPIKGFWLEEHPFSLSMLPKDGRLRITPKAVGDYTTKLPNLAPGTPVVVSGPYGHFTPFTAVHKRLYIAGGVGITPLRAMIEAQDSITDSVLVYGNKTSADIIFAAELDQYRITRKLDIHHVISNEPAYQGETGYVDTARVERLVPDFREREVYLCGPPVMMNGLIAGLTAAGLPHEHLHYERFALHPIS
jgi:predicted ferric reductase